MRPSVSFIRKMRVGAWGTFKHRLVEIGVIPSVDADVPEEWKRVYCKAFGRPYPMR